MRKTSPVLRGSCPQALDMFLISHWKTDVEMSKPWLERRQAKLNRRARAKVFVCVLKLV